MTLTQYLDYGSLVVIVVTFVLFALSLVTKGLTHDLLLEIGVFLVSVKLIIMSYKSVETAKKLHTRFDEIQETLERIAGAQ